MKSLYINTALNFLQICFKDGDSVHNFLSSGEKSQSEEIFDAISSVLGGVKISDLDFVVAIVGPGSFTGIRLGLSVIKGFLIATGVRVICLSNFEAMYYTYKNAGLSDYNIYLDAAGKDCYYGRLDADGCKVGEYSIVLKDAVLSDVPVISNFYVGQNVIGGEISPVAVLSAVEEKFDRQTFVQEPIEPLYIKPHYANIKKR